MRFLGAVVATVLASSLATLAACSATDKTAENVPTAEAVSTANVQIALMDASGAQVGTASGVLIAPRLVLTAGHVISGKTSWKITWSAGKQVVGSRGLTYDWQTYDSLKAHPRRHDVGVIHLDAPIDLDAYPRLVGDRVASDLQATRVRGVGSKFETLPLALRKIESSPNNLIAALNGASNVDTGGAVYDERGIIGVVSGRGLTTGDLYVARTDKLNAWLSAKVACANGSAVRTYAEPGKDKSQEICDDAGNPISNTSSSGASGSNPNSPGGPNDPGGPNSCRDVENDGICSGTCGGTNGTPPSGDDDDDDNGGPSGNTGGGGGSSSGSSGSSGSNSTNPGGPNGPSGGSDPSQPGGNPGSGQSSGEPGRPNGGGGPNGNVGSSSGNPDGASNGGGSNGGGAGTKASSDGEKCQGSNDNPELCPPEPQGCQGAACGGGTPDDLIDYGACACGGRSDGKLDVR